MQNSIINLIGTIGFPKKGKVVLAGAGPGDPDLISVKAVKHLQKADVILIDRLVSPELVNTYAKENAIVHYVGKQCSKGVTTPQNRINELMVEYAFQGKNVLRLKGGDASLFSNILDELETLTTYNIAYEIVPGISAAFGAAAYTGIPLTARGHSRGARFLTLFDLKSVKESEWGDWAKTDDTLVFYMSGQKLADLAKKLKAAGVNPSKSIAIISQATTPDQKTKVFSFDEAEKNKLPDFEYVPTLIIVGNVVNLHKQFAWYKENPFPESYFDKHPQPKDKDTVVEVAFD